jgi:hypothetical protein
VAVFNSRYEASSPHYSPRAVQIEVGSSQAGPFHYKSPIFPVQANSEKEQIFTLAPDLVIGEYIKVHLIGKP